LWFGKRKTRVLFARWYLSNFFARLILYLEWTGLYKCSDYPQSIIDSLNIFNHEGNCDAVPDQAFLPQSINQGSVAPKAGAINSINAV